MNETPRVEAVIDDVMAMHSRISPSSQAKYYEEVHQRLAPLARDLERELRIETQKVDDMAAIVRRLAHSLRQAAPGNDLPEKALDYLKRAGVPTSVLREIENKVTA